MHHDARQISGSARSRRARNIAGSRPDRVAMWAFVMALVAVLVAAASARASTTGGAAPPDSGSQETAAQAPSSDESFRNLQLGRRDLAPGTRGTDVRTLQSIVRGKRFGRPRVSGEYDSTTTSAVERFQSRAGLDATGFADRATTRALLRSMTRRRATWYGPGFYGRRTACGQRLTRRTVGVAHRTLPCGTYMTVAYRGRYIETRVIDRGPFVRGVSLDLTYAAARRLRFSGKNVVRTVHERPTRSAVQARRGSSR